MPVTFVNPEGLVSIDVYRQVSIATGSKIVSIAGQVAWDRDGATLGKGDLAAQVESATSISAPPCPGSAVHSTM